MKCCTKCGIAKPRSEFHRQACKKDGLRSWCIGCRSIAKPKKDKPTGCSHAGCLEKHYLKGLCCTHYLRARRGSTNNRPPRRVGSGFCCVCGKPREGRASCDECALKAKRAWKSRNPQVEATRRANKLQATPAWANDFFIKEIYTLAALRTKVTGFEWHVDHQVPLRSKLVCGLHWEGNLQVIPAKANIAKSNRFWPDMP